MSVHNSLACSRVEQVFGYFVIYFDEAPHVKIVVVFGTGRFIVYTADIYWFVLFGCVVGNVRIFMLM